MNCFQIVSLTYLSQHFRQCDWFCCRCELLSDCIFDIPITTWRKTTVEAPAVVNCFQIVSLTYLSQPWAMAGSVFLSCELLSDCIFDIPITTYRGRGVRHSQLWIAFRLYLWHTYHNRVQRSAPMGLVVNCFQIVSLTYLSQLAYAAVKDNIRCELLSDCIFDIPITTYKCG